MGGRADVARGPVLGVSALVVERHRLLMVLRGSRSPLGGRWSLPGGKVRGGETLEQAVRREVREETGLRVHVGDVVAAITTPRGSNRYAVVCFRADVRDGKLRAGDDTAAAEWVTLEDVFRRRTTPQLRTVLRKALGRRLVR